MSTSINPLTKKISKGGKKKKKTLAKSTFSCDRCLSTHRSSKQNKPPLDFPAVLWLKFHTLNSEDMDLIPDQGTEIPHTAQFNQKRKERNECLENYHYRRKPTVKPENNKVSQNFLF